MVELTFGGLHLRNSRPFGLLSICVFGRRRTYKMRVVPTRLSSGTYIFLRTSQVVSSMSPHWMKDVPEGSAFASVDT